MPAEAVPYPEPSHGLHYAPPEDFLHDQDSLSPGAGLAAHPPSEADALAIARLMVRARGCERRNDAEGAARNYAQVLALDPEHGLSMLRLANHHLQHQDPHQALALVDRALLLMPREPALHYTRGNALHQATRPDDAIGAYERAIDLGFPPAQARFAKAGAALMKGDITQGWALYENRPTLDALLAPWTRLGLAPLPPGHSTEGRGLLLLTEQGYGDMLQFVRFAADVAAATDAPVWLGCPAALGGLFGRLAASAGLRGLIHQVPRDPAGLPEGVGWVLPLLSAPLHLGLRRGWDRCPGHPDHRPAAQGYLQADPARVAQWQSRLGPRTRPRVALAWNGGEDRQADWGRSLPLAQLLPWLPAGIDYLHLQPEVRPSDREVLASAPHIRHFGADIGDFDDSAALCVLADRVVSVCTSAAHLAGALGQPTTVLLRRTPCWRWGPEGETSAWYPSARLLRQPEHRHWEPVLAALHQELVALRDGHSTEAMATTINPTAAQSCQ